MNVGQSLKVSQPVSSERKTDYLIASMVEKTEQLHKQLYMLTEKLELVLGEESQNKMATDNTEIIVECRLHERLMVLQENLVSVSRHIQNLTERVVL